MYWISLTWLKNLAENSFSEMRRGNISEQLYYIIGDIEQNRLYKPVTIHTTEEKRYFMKVNYDNKGIDMINLPSILNHPEVVNTVPIYFNNKAPPCISYKYTNTIANKIFNHTKTVKEFCADSMNDEHSCGCSNSDFKYEHSDHIVTGDLSFITNSKLRNLIRKGPKYREPRKILWKNNEKLIIESVTNYAKSWAKREGSRLFVLNDWLEAIKLLVKQRINQYKYFRQKDRPVLKDPVVVEYLDKLHNDFVVAPADKASNNVVFICKKYYYSVLAKELGINNQGGISGNNTYISCDESEQEIITNHISFLLKYNIVPKGEEHSLPFLYWLPKLHKTPYGSRFIAASSKCTTKTLSVLLTRGLEKVEQYMKNRSSIILKNSGINNMWILRNSQSLTQSIKSSSIDTYDSITTWDFSTLYTTIPHSDLVTRISNLIKLTFKKNDNQSLLVNERNAYFSDDEKDGYLSFTCKQYCDLLIFLISNIYIKLGDTLFRQIIGIPMGTNCAPLLANLYLFSYESDFMMKLMKDKKLHLARKFNFTFRYIDDLISFHNPKFKDYISQIYPKELVLKETTESENSCSYLDLCFFRTNDNCLKTKIYDKRDEFTFDIINYPYIDSNIPSSPAYGVYISRLVAFARACSNLQDFVFRHDLLARKLVSQGYNIKILRKSFTKFTEKHYDLVCNFNINNSDFFRKHLSLLDVHEVV